MRYTGVETGDGGVAVGRAPGRGRAIVSETTYAQRIHRYGGPEVLQWERVDLPPLGPKDARVRQTAIGLNFIDTYHRGGLYPVDTLPAVLGVEAAGIVEAVGAEVQSVRVGDRVGCVGQRGAYAERRVVRADSLLRLPDDVDNETAAAMLLKGLTAHLLVRQVYRVGPQDTVLVHAVAGGVGLLLCQWAKSLGATVIGTVGSQTKERLAADAGCDLAIRYRSEDLVAAVLERTDGAGVQAVYDGVGEATFDDSLACLSHGGMMVSFGNASGPVAPFDLMRLAERGLAVTRPSVLSAYLAPGRAAECRSATDELFEVLRAGALQATIGRRFGLDEAGAAHRALEARETWGGSLLLPPADVPQQVSESEALADE